MSTYVPICTLKNDFKMDGESKEVESFLLMRCIINEVSMTLAPQILGCVYIVDVNISEIETPVIIQVVFHLYGRKAIQHRSSIRWTFFFNRRKNEF